LKKEPKLYKRYLIQDADDHSPEYLEKIKRHEANGTGLLTLSGVSGKNPRSLTHKDLLHSFECLKVLYCMREREYQQALAELSKYQHAQKARQGLLKGLGAPDLDPFIFIRLSVLRFNELSKGELEPLTIRKPDTNHYVVKRLGKTKFREHLKKASNIGFGINYPRSRSPNFIHALKVMAIGVLEDYLGRELSANQRLKMMDGADDRIKELLKILNRMD